MTELCLVCLGNFLKILARLIFSPQKHLHTKFHENRSSRFKIHIREMYIYVRIARLQVFNKC